MSGAGKTTMLNRLSGEVAFTHLEASRLIKSEQALRSIAAQSSGAHRYAFRFRNASDLHDICKGLNDENVTRTF